MVTRKLTGFYEANCIVKKKIKKYIFFQYVYKKLDFAKKLTHTTNCRKSLKNCEQYPK